MFEKAFLLALLAFSVKCFADTEVLEDSPDDDVVVLTNSNFDEVTKKNDVVLVKFYAPWCGHCKKMAPEFAKAASLLKAEGSPVVLAKVDAVAQTELADKHKIGEFPTLFLFRSQKPEKYTGGRTAELIVEWINTMTGPAVIELDGKADDKVTKESSIVYVGEFKSKDSELSKMFEVVAGESRQLGKFYANYSSGEEKIYGLRFEEGSTPFSGKTVDELRKFVGEESFPFLGPINGENFWKYNDRTHSFVWFCASEKDFDEYKTHLREAAKELRPTFSFVWLDTDQFKGHAETSLGVSEFPAFVVQKVNSRYLLPDASVTMKNSSKVIEFLNDVEAGKIERNLKSEPIPEKNDEDVKVVVGKSFESMILQKDKDVFLEVYSPWCVYCKSFEPIYTEFAQKMKSHSHVLVAKIDGTVNETSLDAFTWNSFPSIFFVKAGETTPMKFDGSRTVEGLMEFYEKHASKPLGREPSEL